MLRNKRGRDKQKRKKREGNGTLPFLSRSLPIVLGAGLGASVLGLTTYKLSKPKRMLKNRLVNQAKDTFAKQQDQLIRDIDKYKISNPNKSMALEMKYNQVAKGNELALKALRDTPPEVYIQNLDNQINSDRFEMAGIKLKDELKIPTLGGKARIYAKPKEYKKKLKIANIALTGGGVGIGGYFGGLIGNNLRNINNLKRDNRE